ncbi:MAG: beta-ketoacyl synthase chain length factor, partial [Myxococcales bacterium]|nr:beta-ketoacyl synthase chain length factor [Myxococcales bacterium]
PGGWDGLADALRAGRPVGLELHDPPRPEGIPFARWRRLSRLSRFAASAVLPLLEEVGDPRSVPLVLGSAMGEVVPSSAFLDRLFAEGPENASPLAFQGSVYNATAAGLSLAFDLRGPSQTVSAGMMTGLAALRRGLSLLASHGQALVVLADDRNPTTSQAYGERPYAEAVVALLLERGDEIAVLDGPGVPVWGRAAALPYEGRFTAVGRPVEATLGLHPASGLLAWLATGEPAAEHDDGVCLRVSRPRPAP